MKKNNEIELYGKVAKMPKNLKASEAYNELQKIKIDSKKIWYFIIENTVNIKNDGEQEIVQVIKYNPDNRVDLKDFLNDLKSFYNVNDKEIYEHIKKVKIVGSKDFIAISNISNTEINGKKLISIIVEDLVRILYE